MRDQRIESARKKVFSQMLTTRGSKYRWFILALQYVPLNKTRKDLLLSSYTAIRYLDDIVDGDIPIPNTVISISDYVQEKIDFIENLGQPKDDIELLLLHSFHLADTLGYSIAQETKDILSSLLFDAKRKSKGITYPEKVLYEHFYNLDIRGTVREALMLFGENPELYPHLEPLGRASRIYYNLRDFEEDIRAGYVNVSQEDCEYFRITPQDLENRLSLPIQAWFRHQALSGRLLISQHRDIMHDVNFHFLTKLTLSVAYEWPAQRYFTKALNVK